MIDRAGRVMRLDRRHVVLGVALAASVATEKPPPPALFYGRADLHAGSFVLDTEQPTLSWIVTTTVVLPEEAGDRDFHGFSGVGAEMPEGAPAYPVRLSLNACSEAGQSAVLTAQPSGIPLAELSIDHAFGDCVTLEPCTQTFCVELTNDDVENAADVQWSTWTVIESDDPVGDEDDASIPVSISITIESVEP